MSEQLAVLKGILENLVVIRQLMELQLRKLIKEELERVASTPERKKMWILCDGATSTSEISRKVGVSTRAVQYFIRDAQRLELIRIDKRGFPRRAINWIPSDWQKLVENVSKRDKGEKYE